MDRIARWIGLCLGSGFAVLLVACGGGSNSSGGGGNPTTPAVTVRPAKSSITIADSLQVDVAVTGTSSTVTGTVVLSGGTYTSSATALSGGSASVTIPAGSLAAGTATIRVTYTPDSGSSSTYNSASGTGTVTVNVLTPTVTVTPSPAAINTLQSFSATVTVAGPSGFPTPSGTITLTSGTVSRSATLTGGTATIPLAGGLFAPGTATLTAAYAPDTTGGKTYGNASGTATVAVTAVTPTVTVTPASDSVGISQALSVTVKVSGPSGADPVPTGNVTLTTSGFTSAATALSTAGTATITIPAGTLAAGSATLSVSYAPDTVGALIYGSASGSASVTFTNQVTPAVTVSPASASLSTAQPLNVTVKVNGTSGGTTPTGSVILSSGTYASSASTLSAGSATISIPAYSLVYGSDTLSAAYTPDENSAPNYNNATGSANVSVARVTPTVKVTPGSLSIDTTQSLNVSVSVTGPGTGPPPATGTISLSGGGYTSPSPVALTGGSASITIAAGGLAPGSNTLTASYTPDTVSSPIFNSTTGASAAITVTAMSTIAVTQGTSIGTVTNQVMGLNLAAWYDDVANANSINTAFGQAGIKVIRWPGGSWSDAWHWHNNPTNALLPYMCNTTGSGTGWGGNSSFSDFVTAIPKAGSYDLALTANYGSNAACNGGGDPTEAAAWTAEAVAEGYPPSHMTVGNENYGSWEYDLHAKKNDAGTYVSAMTGANGYYSLIKAASPSTLVGVVVDAGSIQAAWDSTVLSQAKGSYEFVEYHYYPQNPPNESDTYLVHQAALDFSKSITTLRNELSAAGVPSTPIFVGEIGSVSSNPGKQSWSITQGLYAGQILGEMMNDGIARATWWIGFGNCNGSAGNMGSGSNPIYGWQTFGAYNVFSDGPSDTTCPGAGPIGTMSPTARAFQLFSNIADSGASHTESVLSAKVTGDTTNIRAYAATNNGGTALFLFNLNETLSEPVTITLSIDSSSTDVKVITYDKAIYDQTNAATPVWAAPTTVDMGAQSLPLKLTLTPWSMNVVIIK